MLCGQVTPPRWWRNIWRVCPATPGHSAPQPGRGGTLPATIMELTPESHEDSPAHLRISPSFFSLPSLSLPFPLSFPLCYSSLIFSSHSVCNVLFPVLPALRFLFLSFFYSVLHPYPYRNPRPQFVFLSLSIHSVYFFPVSSRPPSSAVTDSALSVSELPSTSSHDATTSTDAPPDGP